ncbi:4Fe-4S cluster-binding domain-containing protein [Methanolapillus ohkumae]|uniref:Lysine 2,3-aminomutase n=1 Tax=Methanolapillus ohkumae TaxID=3028298 RepID=A0AA96V8A4_9EURY|nr:hypothetical protein MsAm2_14580 [Methanosarcinaceae archaeon Am2]
MDSKNKKAYQAYTLRNFNDLDEIRHLSEEDLEAVEVVGQVLPFKTNNYAAHELIDWDNVSSDAMFTLHFPRRDMLTPEQYETVKSLLFEFKKSEDPSVRQKLDDAVEQIRMSLNPHSSGQSHNMPVLDGVKLTGLQHKYRETVLFFPGPGQTCHAYCSFCFRWPQFSKMAGEDKFSIRENYEMYMDYIKSKPDVTDVLFTGGDPMTMNTNVFSKYVDRLLEEDMKQIKTIRIGTKSLAHWPYRFTTDNDADGMIQLFEKIVAAEKHLAVMAHFNHPKEMETPAVKEAIHRILCTNAQIRTQSPVLNHINNDPALWARMWRRQADLGCIPYYMFVARDTGAKHYFEVPLERAQQVFREAYQSVSGICRTVRGPSMSDHAGKIQILGTSEVYGEKIFVLRFLQGRNPNWVAKPFFAKYDPEATWFDQLKPAFGEKEFFFESEIEDYLNP